MSSDAMPIIHKVVVPEGADLMPTINKVGGQVLVPVCKQGMKSDFMGFSQKPPGLEQSVSWKPAWLGQYNSCHQGPCTCEFPCNDRVWCGVGAACGAVSRFGACVPRAPGALANRLKIRSFEGTECPRIFFGCFWS